MASKQSASSHTFEVTTPSDREIRMTRTFAAPRRLVFEVLTKPEHVKRWWGVLSDDYVVEVCEIDLRVGGAWRWISRFPRGEAIFYGVYKEIVPHERLVYTEIFAPYPDEESLVTTTLVEEAGKTHMTLTAVYSSLAVRDMVLTSGMEKGAAISYDRLEDIAIELVDSR